MMPAMRWLPIMALLLLSVACADDPISAATDVAVQSDEAGTDGADVPEPQPDAEPADELPEDGDVLQLPPDEGPGPDVGTTDCATVAPDVCAETAGCDPIFGFPAEQRCAEGVDPGLSVARGCMAEGTGCDGAITCGQSPAGEHVFFTSSCIPAGWEEISTDECCPIPDAPPAEFTACQGHKDCVAVEMGCCDHCNGGKLLAVNVEFAGSLDPWKETGCEMIGCTKIGCGPVEAVCNSGVCAWQQQDLSPDCEGLSQESCDKTPGCAGIKGAPAAEICMDNFDNWGSIWSGCMSADMGCGEAETCAQSPVSGEQLVFPTTCIPDGWAVKGECCASE